MADPLAKEKAFLKEHQAELGVEHPGKYLLIKNESVQGAFETYEEGVNAGVLLFGAGPFLVRSILQPDDLEAPSIPALSIGVPLSLHRRQENPTSLI